MPHRMLRLAAWTLAALSVGWGGWTALSHLGPPGGRSQAVAAEPAPLASKPEPPSRDLPSYARKDPATAALYRWAAAHRRELQYIPCACGCEMLQHRSAWNCFVKAELTPGFYAWDDHGVECRVCQAIALQVQTGLAKGKKLKRIRQEVDAQWGPIGMKTPYPPD